MVIVRNLETDGIELRYRFPSIARQDKCPTVDGNNCNKCLFLLERCEQNGSWSSQLISNNCITCVRVRGVVESKITYESMLPLSTLKMVNDKYSVPFKIKLIHVITNLSMVSTLKVRESINARETTH